VELIMQLNVRQAHQLVVRIMSAMGHDAADGGLIADRIDIPDLLFEQLTRIAGPDLLDHGRTKHD
jgi:hypothetical protein